MEMDMDVICKEIQEGNSRGKVSWIIIVAEGKAKAQNVADIITKNTGFETRVAVLGHIQRGGRPTATDRLLAAKLGNYAVECLKDGMTNHCVTIKNEKFTEIPLNVAIQQKEIDISNYYRLIKILT
jgi:6-phosphofructokinase 1